MTLTAPTISHLDDCLHDRIAVRRVIGAAAPARESLTNRLQRRLLAARHPLGLLLRARRAGAALAPVVAARGLVARGRRRLLGGGGSGTAAAAGAGAGGGRRVGVWAR
jgi:hypothetical protein